MPEPPWREVPRPLNVRRQLLNAVENFIEGTPDSLARARRIVQRCYTARQFVTLDEIVWGGIIMELTDSLFYEDRTYLEEVRSLLAHGSPKIHCAYLNQDCRPRFTWEEQEWYTNLLDMLDLLTTFRSMEEHVAITEYERRSRDLANFSKVSPAPARFGDEMIHHLILREVTEIVTSVNLRFSIRYVEHLAAGACSIFPPPKYDSIRTLPDATESIAWVKRALRSIIAEEWLLITWQVTPVAYNLSFH